MLDVHSTILDYRERDYAESSSLFSSFAYLIDATYIYLRALRAVAQFKQYVDAEALCSDIEAGVTAWLLMLPPKKQQLESAFGSVDQILLQAHLMIHT